MTLAPNQAEYRGLRFGDGTNFLWGGSITGLRQLVVASAPMALARRDGYAGSCHWVRPPRAVIPLRILRDGCSTDAELEARVAEAEATFTLSRDTAYFLEHRFAGPERAILARVLERQVTMFPGWLTRRAVSMAVAFERLDPYLYGTELHSIMVPIYQVSGGGVNFDALPAPGEDFDEFPLNFGAPSGLEGVAVNGGDATAYPLIRVLLPSTSAGEVTGFQLINLTTGVTFDLAVALTPGQTLDADMAAIVRGDPGPTIHIDGANRAGGWQHPRIPWGLAPGSNTIHLVVEGTATDVTASLTWRDTWL